MTHPQGHSAHILAFPAKVHSPVQQEGRPGRYPLAVASLRRVRLARSQRREAEERARLEAENLLSRAEAYLYAVFKLRGMIEEERS